MTKPIPTTKFRSWPTCWHSCVISVPSFPTLPPSWPLSRLNRLFLFLPSLGIESCGDEDGAMPNTFRSAGAAVSGLTFSFPPSFFYSAWIISPSLDLLLHAPVSMADVKFLIASHVYTPACPHTVCPRHIRGAVTSSPRSNFSRPYAVARAGAQDIVGTISCGPYTSFRVSVLLKRNYRIFLSHFPLSLLCPATWNFWSSLLSAWFLSIPWYMVLAMRFKISFSHTEENTRI